MTRRNGKSVSLRRFIGAMNLGLFIVSVLAIGVVVNFFSLRPGWRQQIDATKTRAYSLSTQTTQLLETLDGDWTIALLMDERNVDPSVRRQIDEVLRRFAEAAPSLDVTRINPTDPGDVAAYDALLARLRGIYADLIHEYDMALDEGERVFAQLQAFARQQARPLQAVIQAVPQEAVKQYQLDTRAALMNVLATESGKVTELIRNARQVSDIQPIPDFDGARSILFAALREWSNQLDELALVFDQLQERPDLDNNIRRYLASTRESCEATSQALMIAADPLGRLEPLELSSIGRRIQEGECALVIGPGGAAAIRSAQLFPTTNVRPTSDAAVTFDQRFRGEQLIASTIRSMRRDHMPLVIFVHASEQTLLMPTENQADLVGVRGILSTSRFDVKEWPVSLTMQPPDAKPGQPVVWVIVPPSAGAGLELGEGEEKLIRVAGDLVDAGEPVMFSIYPSRLVRFGQRDPWLEPLGRLGVEADTSRAIFERVRGAGGQAAVDRGQTLQTYPAEHPVARAVDGLKSYFGLPVPLTTAEESGNSSVAPLVVVAPDERRWLERDWYEQQVADMEPKAESRLTEPTTIAMAIERPHPVERDRQRCIVVGSGGWMLTYISDRVYSFGGGRMVLEFPGNYEFMLASIAWLAGMDDLIAPSAMSQEVPRLRDVAAADRRRWFWVTIAGLPGACIGLGLVTWVARRF